MCIIWGTKRKFSDCSEISLTKKLHFKTHEGRLSILGTILNIILFSVHHGSFNHLRAFFSAFMSNVCRFQLLVTVVMCCWYMMGLICHLVCYTSIILCITMSIIYWLHYVIQQAFDTQTFNELINCFVKLLLITLLA